MHSEINKQEKITLEGPPFIDKIIEGIPQNNHIRDTYHSNINNFGKINFFFIIHILHMMSGQSALWNTECKCSFAHRHFPSFTAFTAASMSSGVHLTISEQSVPNRFFLIFWVTEQNFKLNFLYNYWNWLINVNMKKKIKI